MSNYEWKAKKKKKKDNLIFVYIGGGLLFLAALIGIILFAQRGPGTSPAANLGEQQRQQVRELASQLIENILDNQNNFNRLTTDSNGTKRNINEIEEIFLSNSLSPSSPDIPAPIKTPSSLAPEVIEQSWYELRIFLLAGLQNQSTSLLENIQQRVKSDTEKWLKAATEKAKEDLLEQYFRIIQEVKTVQELFKEYGKIRNDLVINRVDRSKELIAKGYSEIDIIQLKEWNLLDQDFPNLYHQERIGVTKALSALSQKYRENGQEKRKITGGLSRDLLLFLKLSKNQSSTVYFPPDKIEPAQQDSVRKIVEDLIQNSSTGLAEVSNYDIYILRVNSSHEGAGPSSGVAHYLALYSALNQIPLPKNLASTATIEGEKVGGIGGLQHKLATSVKNGIDTFILAQQNQRSQNSEESFADTPIQVAEKIKQVHFISQVSQIETALLEILSEPNRYIVHSCDLKPRPKPGDRPGRNPPEPEEGPNPNSSITSEKLLSLVVEFSLRGATPEQNDFHAKLLAVLLANDDYQKAFQDALKLHQKYLSKISEVEKNNPALDEAKEKTEIDQLKKRIFVFYDFLEERHNEGFADDNQTKLAELELQEIIRLIGENKWIPQNFKNACTNPDLAENFLWDSYFQTKNFSYPGHQLIQEKKDVTEQFDLAEAEIKKQSHRRETILQEYQGLFKVIASTIPATEFLGKIHGYTIDQIEWTGKLLAPSLAGGPSVTFSFTKK